MMKSRRTVLQQSIAVGAGVTLFNIGRAGAAPNQMINHASFGGAGMALSDIKRFRRSDYFNLAAVAEVDDSRLEELVKLYPKVRVYKDWRVLLEKEHKHLDSVNVSTPDHMHAPIGMTAMQLGLPVYGQKPLAQNLYETRRMAEVARETGLVTQMGIQLASSTYERLAAQMIQDGVIGKVKEIHIFSHKTWGDPKPRPEQRDPVPAVLDWDLWCGVGPVVPYIGNEYYHPGGWRCRLDYGTGTLGDMGCHIYSPMFQALNLKAPVSVKSIGGVPNATNWAVDEHFEYTFPGGEGIDGDTLKVFWTDGALRPPRKFRDMFGEKMPKQGGIYVGTEGILLAPHMALPVPYPREQYGEYRYPKLKARDHYIDFLDAVRGESVEPIADFHQYGGPVTETVLLGGLASHFPDETLLWDAVNLQFTNHEKANTLIRRTYRKGWEVDGL